MKRPDRWLAPGTKIRHNEYGTGVVIKDNQDGMGIVANLERKKYCWALYDNIELMESNPGQMDLFNDT